jgi:hypothetical protein
MIKINFPNLDLLQIQLPDSVPWWVAAIFALVSVVSPFLAKKLDFSLRGKSRKSDELMRLVKANTALGTTLLFVLREIEDSEENKLIIETIKEMIKSNFTNEEKETPKGT